MKVIAPGDVEIDLGTVETTPTVGIIDYSRRVTDDFGVTTIVPRGFARRMSVRFALPFDAVDGVQQSLAALRATPAQWVADDRFDWLNFEGFFKDFELDLAVPPLSFCTLTVEGLAEAEPGVDTGADAAPAGTASTFHLLDPVTITDAILTATNIAEAEWPNWSAGLTYALGDRVLKTSTHRVYESAIDGNTGNDPEALSGQWIDVGPTRRWAMFDQALGTASFRFDSIVVTLDPGAVDAVALLDVIGATVRVQTTGYDETKAVTAGTISFLDLPGADAPITVTILGPGTVSVGTLLVGHLSTLGVTGDSPTAGIIDFSRKEVDDFGEVTIVERAWSKRMSARTLISTSAVDLVANRIAAVRARPSLWIADGGTDALTIYGFFKDFSIEVGENVSILSLSVEGLSEAAPVSTGLPPVNWPDVVDSDPAQPKPDDGATVGAPVGTPVGDRSAEQVNAEIDAALAQIDDLFETYGDTASASISAGLAADARADAIAAAAEADGYAEVSQTARDDAQAFASASHAEAVTAGDAASASEASAAAASASESSAATNANLSATAKNALDISLADTMPKAFNPDLFAQVGVTSGTTASVTPLTVTNPSMIAPDRSYIEVAPPGTGLSMRGAVPVQAGDVIRLTADIEQTVSGAAFTSSHFYIRVLDANFNLISSLTANGSFQNLPTGGRGVMVYDIGYNAPGLCDYNITTGGAKYFRCQLLLNRVEGGTAVQSGSTARVHAFYGDNYSATAIADSKAEIATTQAATATAAAASASQNETITATYRDAAQKAAIASIPTTFEDGTTYFASNNGGSVPANMTPNVHATYGPNLTNTINTNWGAVSQKVRRPTTAGKKWKVRALIGHGSGTGAKATLVLEVWPSATGGTRIEQTIVSVDITGTAPTWQEYTFTSANSGFAVPVVLLNYPAPHTAYQRIYAIEMIDMDIVEAAAAQAGIATSQAALATADAAAARQSAILSASLGQGLMNPNSGFDDFPSGAAGALPTGWTNWSGSSGGYRVPDYLGGYAHRMVGAAGQNAGLLLTQTTDRTIIQNEWYVLEADIILNSGTLQGSALACHISGPASGGSTVEQLNMIFPTTPDATGVSPGNGVAGRTYKFSKLFQVTTASAFGYRLYAMTHWTSAGSVAAANDITWLKAGIRPAAPADIAAGTAVPALQATVATHDSVIATHTTQLASRVERVSAGTSTAEIKFVALNSGGTAASSIGISADRVTLGTMTSPVLSISAGRATVSADLYVQNGKIVVDTGTHMKVLGNGFGNASQFVEWFGPKMAINLCSEANAITYVKTTGDAYFGGTLSAGTLKNSAQTSANTTNASIVVGPFGTNGNPIVVAVSWVYSQYLVKSYAMDSGGISAYNADVATYNATSSDGGATHSGTLTETVVSSSVTLARKIGAGSFSNVSSGSTTTRTATFEGRKPVIGDAPGSATIRTSAGLSFTYTDSAGGTSDREFQATLARGYSMGGGTITQRVSIVTTEE